MSVTFQEASAGKGSITWANQARPVSKEQSYDVLSRSGTDQWSGKPIYVSSQDGQADLTIRAQVRDFSGGRWSSLMAGKTGVGLEAGALVMAGTSRSGDAGLISLELRFDPSLQLMAGDFSVKLVSLNGNSSLYEWSMITVGTVEQAPFDPVRIGDYTAFD